MYYVYLIKSIEHTDQTYIGFTENLENRFRAHNAGESKHTAKFRPWRLVSYHAFDQRDKARAFKKYLKTGSGAAFAKKRFW